MQHNHIASAPPHRTAPLSTPSNVEQIKRLRPKVRERKLVWQGGSKGPLHSRQGGDSNWSLSNISHYVSCVCVCHGHFPRLSQFELPCIGFLYCIVVLLSSASFLTTEGFHIFGDKPSSCSEGGSGWVSNSSKDHQQPSPIGA